MRKIDRSTPPTEWSQKKRDWTNKWKSRLNENPSAKFDWYTYKTKSAREWILPSLLDQTQDHCSFCDIFPLPAFSQTPIEHFKPKKQFPDLAFEESNLFACCEKCNGSKNDIYSDQLLKPDSEEYAFVKYFQYNFETGEILPSVLSPPEDKTRALKTIDAYDLNCAFRCRHRKLELRQFLTANRISQTPNIDEYCYRDFIEIGSL